MNALQLWVLPLLSSLLLSFFFEQLLSPKPKLPWQRASVTILIHIGTWFVLFSICLVLLRRPWFAITLLLVFQLFLLLVNQAKYHSLREAFFFQDFEYFTDAIKNPRLYLPFFGITRTILAIIGFVSALTLGLKLESTFIYTYEIISVCLIFLLVGSFLIYWGLKHINTTDFDPNDDLKTLGQVSFFWKYWQEEKNTVIDTSDSPFFLKPALEVNDKPNIVVIQSESFFDPRPYFDLIKPSILPHFDQINNEACYYGHVKVPAWGANTVRTECGFLSGLPAEKMGVHRFNPYRFLVKQSIPNLVSYLKQLGYLTICIHPYPASFYQRNKVFPLLGFDRFIDIHSFNKQQKFGQYIGDLAISEKIDELLENENGNKEKKPLFIFSITMENHGPLHLEQPDKNEFQSYYLKNPPEHSDDLTIYLRHLKNADLMIKDLRKSLLISDRPALLCWYGDHVPIMPKVYKSSGTPNGETNYFIWQTTTQAQLSNKHDIAIHDLATLMLSTIQPKQIR